MNEHISQYLEYYIRLKNPQYAVLLKGEWGSGKTYFIKQLQETWVNRERYKDSETDGDIIIIQPIYISLFGLNSITQINDKIRAEIHPFLYSKGMNIGKKILKSVIKGIVKIDLDINNDTEKESNISYAIDSIKLFENDNPNVKGDKILIFDDIERCKIPIEEIFGFINYFVEHLKCKVILISDEDKIRSKNPNIDSVENQINLNDISQMSYKHFKEKIIGQTFEVIGDVDSALNTFFEEIPNLSCKEFLIKNKNLIIELFRNSEKENLRILRQLISDFNRLLEFIDATNKEDVPKYEEFLKHLIVYFIIVYLEYKTGNQDISDFQKFHYFVKTEKEKIEKYNSKYNQFLSEHHILNSTDVLPIENIVQYLESGYIEKDELNNILTQNHFFRLDDEQLWEKLWDWQYIKEKKFKELRDTLWGELYNCKIDNIIEILHIIGIFLTLSKEKLFEKDFNYILKHAKKLIDRNLLYKKEFYDTYQDSSIYRISGKQYQSHDIKEFQELLSYTDKKIRNIRDGNVFANLKTLFENLDDTIIGSIYPKLHEIIPGFEILIQIPIFKTVQGRKLGKKIKGLNYYSIYSFIDFLKYLYYPEKRYTNETLMKYHKEDLKCLEDLKNEINLKINSREFLKNRAFKELDIELGKIIEKINRI